MLKHKLPHICISTVLSLNSARSVVTDGNMLKKGENQMTLHSAENRFERGCPRRYVDGVEVPPIFYALTDLQEARCRTELAQRNVKNFSEAGIDLVQCDWNLRDGWTRENTFDAADFLDNIAPLTHPGSPTRLVVRLHMNPPNWWMDEHPDEMTVFGVPGEVAKDDPNRIITGDNLISRRVSLASKSWLRDAGKVLADFCKKLEASECGGFVIGIQPACGKFGEWHWWAAQYDPDHSKSQTEFFRNYLKEKYRTVEALQKAWHDSHVTFENAEIPSYQQRNSPFESNYRDPKLYQAVIDSHHAQMLVPAEDIIYFCRIIKESTSRPVLTGAFYTYFFSSSKAVGGHLAADMVLKSPYVDYLGAPFAYGLAREPGSSCISRGLLESCRLNKKLFLTEMDQPPEGATNSAPGGDPARDHVTIDLMRRNVLEPFTRGQGLWYYDHRLKVPEVCKNFGWWDTPVLMEEVSKQQKIFSDYFKKPYQSQAELLCVWGVDVMYHTSGNGAAPHVCSDEVQAIEELSRCGVPHDHVYLADLPLVDLKQYKVVLFQYTGMLSPNEREYIKSKVLGSVPEVIFVNNAGYADGKTLSAENMQALTGIKMRETGKHYSCTIGNETVQIPKAYVPLLRPDDADAEVAALFADGKEPAGAVKKQGNSNIWYFAFPVVPSGFLRDLLKKNGSHIYCDKDLVIKAGRGIVCIHAPADGKYKIVLKNGREIETVLQRGETMVFDAESGKNLYQ